MTERVGFSLLLAQHWSATGRRGQAWPQPQAKEQQVKRSWTQTLWKYVWCSGALSLSQSRPNPTPSKVCIPRVSWVAAVRNPHPDILTVRGSGTPWRGETGSAYFLTLTTASPSSPQSARRAPGSDLKKKGAFFLPSSNLPPSDPSLLALTSFFFLLLRKAEN